MDKPTFRKYVAVYLSDDSSKNLRSWAKSKGFDLTVNYDQTTIEEQDFSFHSTIYYTSTYHDEPAPRDRIISPFKLEPVEFAVLGRDRRVPTLIVRSPMLTAMRDVMTDFYGMGDEWDEYKAHISLSYHDKEYDLSKLKLPKSFDLIADRIVIENIEDSD